jgi:hypothetical protein
MEVTVWNGSERTPYVDISAVGIGHIRQDLVLVPRSAEPIEIGPDRWTRLLVDRIEAPLSQEEFPPHPRRAISLGGLPHSDE